MQDFMEKILGCKGNLRSTTLAWEEARVREHRGFTPFVFWYS